MPDEKGRWGFFEIQAEFNKLSDNDFAGPKGEARFRYWVIRLMFESYGGMDSLAVSLRGLDKSYHELVQMSKRKLEELEKIEKDAKSKKP